MLLEVIVSDLPKPFDWLPFPPWVLTLGVLLFVVVGLWRLKHAFK